MTQTFDAKVLTVSDGVAAGARDDRGGDVAEQVLTTSGFEVVERSVVADDLGAIVGALTAMANGFAGLVVTTGGTGFGPRDVTPEATTTVIERDAPGLAEAMRLTNPLGRLSRQRAGQVGGALILNLPGSPRGVEECLDAVLDVVPHILELVVGGRPH